MKNLSGAIRGSLPTQRAPRTTKLAGAISKSMPTDAAPPQPNFCEPAQGCYPVTTRSQNQTSRQPLRPRCPLTGRCRETYLT